MPEPSLLERQMGRRLKRMREQLGMSQEEAGKPLRMSTSKMSRIELGHLPSYNDFRALLDRYCVVFPDTEELIAAYDLAKQKPWWHRYGISDVGFLAIETEASAVKEFQFGYIPALLQTEAYIRAVLDHDPRTSTARSPKNHLAVQLQRQRRLTDSPPLTYHAIIDESALQRPILHRNARVEQLQAVIERAALPNVTVQIIPETTGLYQGRFGGLFIASFNDRAEPETAFVEHAIGSVRIEKTETVSLARRTFKELAARALDETKSVALIDRLATRC